MSAKAIDTTESTQLAVQCTPAIASSAIDPARPPLPTDSSLPFHCDAGSHTSIFMSESAVGRSVANTRQNAGTLIVLVLSNPFTVNGPAGTVCAELTSPWSILNWARDSHVADSPSACRQKNEKKRNHRAGCSEQRSCVESHVMRAFGKNSSRTQRCSVFAFASQPESSFAERKTEQTE
jgi:hypothetical protein